MKKSILKSSQNKDRCSKFGNLFDDDSQEGDLSIDNELDRYLNKKFGPITDDLGQFWRSNEIEFPKLAKLAKRLLAIPAATAENERWFSRLRHLVTENRENLSASTINNICVGRSLMTNKLSLD
jgi:hypothetical protein